MIKFDPSIRRNTPSYRFIHKMIIDARKLLENSSKCRNIVRTREEFEIGLLIDVPIRHTPAHNRIRARFSVHSWLRIDGENSSPIVFDQFLLDQRRLRRDLFVSPRKVLDNLITAILLAAYVTGEHSPHVLFARQLVSPFVHQLITCCIDLQIEQVIIGEHAEGGRRREAPTSIGKLVPVGRAMNVRLGPDAPEDRSNVLLRTNVVARCFLPWQGAHRLFLRPQAELLENFNRGKFTVERIEMETMNFARVQQSTA